jgi:RNA polymerase sigma-70 factor (ECF subfamily)
VNGVEVKDEATLIDLARRGNRDAFGDLVRLHRSGVINVVYHMCGDPALAEDSAQNAFIRAWQNLDHYQPSGSFRSWLYRIAINGALDILRREKPALDLEKMDLVSPGQGIEERLESRERAKRVRKAVRSLPAASRAALILREYEGLSYQEIAEALEISTGTVMSRLNYARNRLLELLASNMEEL